MPKYNKGIALAYFKECGLQSPCTEWKFALVVGREWRMDFAWVDQKVALEVEGLNGRHQFTAGFIEDMEKYNTATLLGWRVLRVTTNKLTTQHTVEMLRKLLV